MSDYGDATALRVEEGGITYVVVERADDVIGISFDLLNEVATTADDPMHRGGFSFDPQDPDLIHFGTPNRGLGRLTYRIHERRAIEQVAVARRVA